MNKALPGMFITFSPEEEAVLKSYCEEYGIEYTPKGMKDIIFSAVDSIDDEEDDRLESGSLSRVIEQAKTYIRENPQAVRGASEFINSLLNKRKSG